MRFSSEFTTPLVGIEDPVACGLHLAGAVFFAWQARKLVRRAGIARRRAAALAIFAGLGCARAGGQRLLPRPLGRAPVEGGASACRSRRHLSADRRDAHAVPCHRVPRAGALVDGRWQLGDRARRAGPEDRVLVGRGRRAGPLPCTWDWLRWGSRRLLVLPRRLPWIAILLMALGGLVYVAGAFADHLDDRPARAGLVRPPRDLPRGGVERSAASLARLSRLVDSRPCASASSRAAPRRAAPEPVRQLLSGAANDSQTSRLVRLAGCF